MKYSLDVKPGAGPIVIVATPAVEYPLEVVADFFQAHGISVNDVLAPCDLTVQDGEITVEV